MNPRFRVIATTAATVLIIALVILGLWAFTAPKSQTGNAPTIQLTQAELSQKAYEDGVAALSKEQTDTAIQLFEQALRYDDSNTDAKEALEDAQQSQDSTTPTSTGTNPATSTPPPAEPSVWTTTIDMKKLLPTEFPNFRMGVAGSGGPTSAEVAASAQKTTLPVQSVSWFLHDFKTNAKAQKFVTDASKELYPKNASSVTVNGVTGYFGTDSAKMGTVVFVRGRYVFEVLITAAPSAQPAAQKDLAVKAASAFATAP